MKTTSDKKPTLSIHPHSTLVLEVPESEGTFKIPAAVINPSATVDSFCKLITHSSLEHDSIHKDYASLIPHASIGGSCIIGACRAYLDTGYTYAHHQNW